MIQALVLIKLNIILNLNGNKFINPNGNKECVIKEKGNYFKGNNNNIYHSIANTVFKYEEGLSGCIYINNTWSKIIE